MAENIVEFIGYVGLVLLFIVVIVFALVPKPPQHWPENTHSREEKDD